jgi:hypothetical protein
MSNPYEYLYRACPSSSSPVSKLKSKSILLYDLIEINSLLDLFGSLKKPKLNILNISENCEDFNYYIDVMKETTNDEITSFYSLEQEMPEIKQKFDFIFFEDTTSIRSNLGCHFKNIIKILYTVLNNLDIGGNCLIKVNNVFYKPLIDMLYLFSSIFEKVHIIKPSTSNAVTFEKYIFCKYFSGMPFNIEYNDWRHYIKNNNDTMSLLYSLIDKEIPSYFLNKVQDLNSVLVQQQLETMEQIINIFKTKNVEEKLELLKKVNVQKSSAWCEKFKIPHHKFAEKINMFLPLSKKSENNFNDTNSGSDVDVDAETELNSNFDTDDANADADTDADAYAHVDSDENKLTNDELSSEEETQA